MFNGSYIIATESVSIALSIATGVGVNRHAALTNLQSRPQPSTSAGGRGRLGTRLTYKGMLDMQLVDLMV